MKQALVFSEALSLGPGRDGWYIFNYMKQLLLLLALVIGGGAPTGQAAPIIRLQLDTKPLSRSLTCRYTFALPAADTATSIVLLLSREFRILNLNASQAAQPCVTRVYYPFFADTLQRLQVRYAALRSRKSRRLTLTYSGVLGKALATEQVMVFSGHSNWIPFRPYREYEVVDYVLDVRVPAGEQVVSTTPALRHRNGQWRFRGRTSLIEITALVARRFQQLASATQPRVTVLKTGAALNSQDTIILRKAEEIAAFYNRSIGREAPIARFSIFLPGTNSDAFGLLNDATVITYSDFDMAKRGELLILAHEISHKWWGYGSVHDENDWLNEAFATYSSLLYLQAAGDAAGYQAELTRLIQTVANTPAILGFDRTKYERSMYRRVVYNKGTGVLAALHARVGTEQFFNLMAKTAAKKVSTTAAFLGVVEQVAGPETRAWLLAELRR